LVIEEFDPTTGIGRLTLNRPEVLNAIDIPTAQAFRDAVLRLHGREDLRCIVLSGRGRAFAAGGDVASFATDSAAKVEAILGALHPAVAALRDSAAPVLAVVQGAAAGAGLSLVLGADVVLAADDARFVIAYDRIGVSPDAGGTWYLARKVPRARAFGMMFLGEALDAEAAREVGIVNEVVPQAELEALADALARRIASGPSRAYAHFKRLYDEAATASLSDQLEAEKRAFLAGTRTSDFREGVAAFIEKRQPRFTGS
jgi:2-(1,2-epoxy-1,2-dihydrophenyl)acetyl-CoA isomerase